MPTTSRAKTTIDGPRSVLDLKRPPTAPGEMLLEEYGRRVPEAGADRTVTWCFDEIQVMPWM